MKDDANPILVRLSRGEIGLMEATAQLGVQDAGYTLQALARAGLIPFMLPPDVVKEQVDRGHEALRVAVKK